MKTLHHSRRLMRGRRIAVIKPACMESNRLALREVLGEPVQTKLRVGAPDDVYEREADRVADQLMGMPEKQLQRQEAEEPLIEEEHPLQVRASDEEEEEAQPKLQDSIVPQGAVSMDRNSQTEGVPLPRTERSFFEPRLGAGLDAVRLHTDTEANRLATGLSARAFTLGSDIYFGSGEYVHGSWESRHLLGHELVHVLQQGSGDKKLRRKIDRISIKKKGIDLYFSLGIYGPNASTSLASTWASNIENNWNQNLKIKDMNVDAKIHVTYKAYPTLPDVDLMQLAVNESNAVYVEKNGFRSYVSYSGWGHGKWSTGRWAKDAKPLVVAHEAGHMMGLEDKYVDIPLLGSVDLPGYEKDIMANFWNDNGKTEFTRGWYGILLYHYFGYRS
nr:DUF4157 domain-containing protein [uncultured Desulfobulbus sp.]